MISLKFRDCDPEACKMFCDWLVLMIHSEQRGEAKRHFRRSWLGSFRTENRHAHDAHVSKFRCQFRITKTEKNWLIALPETSILVAPENRPSQKENHLPTIDFQGKSGIMLWASKESARQVSFRCLWPETGMKSAVSWVNQHHLVTFYGTLSGQTVPTRMILHQPELICLKWK